VSKFGGHTLGFTKPKQAHEDQDAFLRRVKSQVVHLMPHDVGLPAKCLQIEVDNNTACAFWDEALVRASFDKTFNVERDDDDPNFVICLTMQVPESLRKVGPAIKLYRQVEGVDVGGANSQHEVDISSLLGLGMLTTLHLSELSVCLQTLFASSLRELTLAEATIRSSDVWEHLARFVPSTLKVLDVTNCPGFTRLPSQVGFLKKVVYLSIESCKLGGMIPSCINQLKNLRILHFWDNRLTGSIPSVLGDLKQLQTLSLAHNKLSGQIPPSLGNLQELETLHLNDNHLSGSVPSELAQALRLQELDVSNNLLSDNIPSELLLLTNLTMV